MAKKSLAPMFLDAPDAWPFKSLHNEIDRVINEFSRSLVPGEAGEGKGVSGSTLAPNIDIAETDTSLEITAELPGIDETDIDLTVTENAITLKAEKKMDAEREDKGFHLVERRYGMFQRRIALPFKVDPDKVEANFGKGVLKIIVEKPPETENSSRKIDISADA